MINRKKSSMLSSSSFLKNSDCSRYLTFLRDRNFPQFPVEKVEGKSFTLEWLRKNSGMSRPILINGTKESIRLEVPAATAVSQIVNDIGKDTPIKIIEVGSQSEIEGYTIGDFASYLNERTTNHKVLNLISLEVSNTPLNSKVSSPRIVRFVDWIDIVWPIERRSRGDYPQVQKYCLTGMAGSYTDFHIDFGGTSVWYHVLHGKKRFFFVPPTVENLKQYQKWICSKDQDSIFFGDLVPNMCFYIDLNAGQTLFIPSGWIHSVYTPEDSLVFGGNFLFSYSIFRQLQVHSIEDQTHVKKAYRFPYFRQICFYTLCFYLSKIKNKTDSFNHSKLTDLKIQDLFESKYLYYQFPYLLKSCETWILSSSTTDINNYILASTKLGFLDIASFFDYWWKILLAFSVQLDQEEINQTDASTTMNIQLNDSHLNHIENIKNAISINFLSDDTVSKAILPHECEFDWKFEYKIASENGLFPGCEAVEYSGINSAKSESSEYEAIVIDSTSQTNTNTSLASQSMDSELSNEDKVSAAAVAVAVAVAVSSSQYHTRGKRLSSTFLSEHEEIDLEFIEENNKHKKKIDDDEEEYRGKATKGNQFDCIDNSDEYISEDEMKSPLHSSKKTEKIKTSNSSSASSAGIKTNTKKSMTIRQMIKQKIRSNRR